MAPLYQGLTVWGSLIRSHSTPLKLFTLFMLGCVLLWLVKINATHIHQGCFSGTGAHPSANETTWWHHQMETFSALLAICVGNSPVTGEFPTQRPVTQSFDVFFDLRLNKRLNKKSYGWWFETPSCSLWCHSNEPWKNWSTMKWYYHKQKEAKWSHVHYLWICGIHCSTHDDSMTCESFPHYWPFV